MTLYKYKSVEHLEDVIVTKRLFASRFDKLNDPMEWAFINEDGGKDAIEALVEDTRKEKYRICCLSKSIQYGLMWSMYADEHRGVCIELEVNNDGYLNKSELSSIDTATWYYGDVVYESCAPILTIDDIRQNICQVLWTKSVQWLHENEVRYVTKTDNADNPAFLPITIKKIYLGKRMDKAKAKELQEICKKFDIDCVDLSICSEKKNNSIINYWGLPVISE